MPEMHEIAIESDELESLIAHPASSPLATRSSEKQPFSLETNINEGLTCRRPHIPLHAYALLPLSILAISSSGTVFLLMSPLPPSTLAAWRLQVTSLILLVLASVQWRSVTGEERKRITRVDTIGWLLIAGICLSLHFGLWVASLSLTTLTHSLLFVTSTPLWVAAWSLITRRPITRLEVVGLVLGAGGAVVVSLSSSSPIARSSSQSGSNPNPSFLGGLAALAAAIAIVPYLEIRKHLSTIGLWVYIFPVTATACLLLSIAALVVDRGSQVPHAHIFGYMESLYLAGLVVYAALGPGLVGHAGFNHLLRYMSTLSISLSFQLEPLIGSIIGYMFGVLLAPSALTIVGGMIMIGGTAIVIWGGSGSGGKLSIQESSVAKPTETHQETQEAHQVTHQETRSRDDNV